MEDKDKLHARRLRDKTTISNVNGSVQTVATSVYMYH